MASTMRLKRRVREVLPVGVRKPISILVRVVRAQLHNYEKRRPMIVYSMPKAGTSTVVATLEGMRLGKPVYKAHRLTAEGLRLSALKREQYAQRKRLNVDTVAYVVQRKLERNLQIRPEVVTLTREPIAQAVSRLFQGIENHQPQLIDAGGAVKLGEALAHLQERFEGFDEGQQPELSWYDMVWFERELQVMFGVDVYAQAYDVERGYSIIRGSRADVLVMRAEDLNCSLRSALKEFLDWSEPIEMRRENVGEDKQHQAAYKYVKEHLVVPRAVCEKIYATRYAQHFYTDAERQQLIEKWSGEGSRKVPMA